MIITLQITCIWGAYLQEECVRTVEIDEEATLYDLHDTIQDAVKFERDHLFGFFLANSTRGSKTWLSDAEGWEEMQDDYADIRICDVFPTGRKRLYYLFDFGDDWTFEVRKLRGKKPPGPKVKYPRLIESIGPNPEQYPEFEE